MPMRISGWSGDSAREIAGIKETPQIKSKRSTKRTQMKIGKVGQAIAESIVIRNESRSADASLDDLYLNSNLLKLSISVLGKGGVRRLLNLR
jgi:hypothetical protein